MNLTTIRVAHCRSQEIWALSQKLLALAIAVIGLIYIILGIFDIPRGVEHFGIKFVFIGVISYKLEIFIISKILEKKYKVSEREKVK